MPVLHILFIGTKKLLHHAEQAICSSFPFTVWNLFLFFSLFHVLFSYFITIKPAPQASFQEMILLHRKNDPGRPGGKPYSQGNAAVLLTAYHAIRGACQPFQLSIRAQKASTRAKPIA